MAHARCVKFLKVHRRGIQLVEHSITQEISMFTQSFWTNLPLCNVYRLWQPDELHQLLLGLVKDLLHWLLKYVKARNVKDQFDNQFTSVRRYPGLQCFSKPFNSMKSGSWQGKEIRGMIRTLAVNCAPIIDCSKDDGKTPVETASDEMVMGVRRRWKVQGYLGIIEGRSWWCGRNCVTERWRRWDTWKKQRDGGSII
jgi:hypothetical protein